MFCSGALWGAQLAAAAQETSGKSAVEAKAPRDAVVGLSTPNDVPLEPVSDREIEARLRNILKATTWFETPDVRVEQGVVFLSGKTHQEEYRLWAGELAKKTQDVVAVVNQIQVLERSAWDLTPAWLELKRLSRQTVESLPLVGISLVLLVLTWFSVAWATAIAQIMLGRRINNRLLVSVFSRAIAAAVFILGLYMALRVSGLAQMAATVLGGTGLIGLILGIAFRDIAENFLASILISMQSPFALGDLIQVAEHKGIVQSVTTRGTLLMTEDGNHVQIPNALVYKSVIRNLTANPNVRCDFLIGITYDNCVAKAQEIILKVLKEHEAVLDHPDPHVLIEDLAATAVNLRVYLWVDAHAHSATKVRSSVLRLTKAALEAAGVTLPANSARKKPAESPPATAADGTGQATRIEPPKQEEPRTVANEAEGDLGSDREALSEQARKARKPEAGTNLLSN